MFSKIADDEREFPSSAAELHIKARDISTTYANEKIIFIALLMTGVLSVFEPGNTSLQDKDTHWWKLLH